MSVQLIPEVVVYVCNASLCVSCKSDTSLSSQICCGMTKYITGLTGAIVDIIGRDVCKYYINSSQLVVPRYSLATVGRRAFGYAGL